MATMNFSAQPNVNNSSMVLAAQPSEMGRRNSISSVEIAEEAGRNHKDVMRSIREMESAWEQVNGRKFALVDYIDKKGESRPCYQFNYEEFMYVISKFDDITRAKLVTRWAKLETGQATPVYQVPQSFADALMLAAQQQKRIEEQQKLIETKNKRIVDLEEQTEYTRTILNSPSTVLVTQIAQDYGFAAKVFNEILHKLKIQRKVGKQWILYAKYLKKGYVQSYTHNFKHTDGRDDVALTTKWTQKGRLFLYTLLKKNGYMPLIEQYTII